MIIELTIKLLEQKISFLIDPEQTEINKIKSDFKKKAFVEPEDFTQEDACCVFYFGYMIIYISIPPDEDDFAGLAAHEISHAATFILEHINSECDELRSYICQYLTGEMYRKIRLKEERAKRKNAKQ